MHRNNACIIFTRPFPCLNLTKTSLQYEAPYSKMGKQKGCGCCVQYFIHTYLLFISIFSINSYIQHSSLLKLSFPIEMPELSEVTSSRKHRNLERLNVIDYIFRIEWDNVMVRYLPQNVMIKTSRYYFQTLPQVITS